MYKVCKLKNILFEIKFLLHFEIDSSEYFVSLIRN